MKCLNEEMLSSYIDEVLDPQEQQAVERHLQECWQCRRIQGDYRALSAKISELPNFEVPKDFRQNLMTSINTQKTRTFPFKWVSLAAAVLVCALAFRGFNLFNQPKEMKVAVQEQSTGNSQPETTSKSMAAQDSANQDIKNNSELRSFGSGSIGESPAPPQLADASSNTKGVSGVRNINLELQVPSVDSGSQTVQKQVLEIPGAVVISLNTISTDKVKLQLKIPGPQTQVFLSRLSDVGTVLQGNFTGNIGEESGNNTVTILITKQQ